MKTDHVEERDVLKELAEQFENDKWYLVDVAEHCNIDAVRRVSAEAEAKLEARK